MKTNSRTVTMGLAILTAAAIAFCTTSSAIPPRSIAQAAAEDKDDGAAPAESSGVQKEKVTIQRIEPVADEDRSPKVSAWLGVSATEASEALTSQLDLQPGVGLVVTYVVAESPAAKAGLQKNDLLIGFDDQSLVHPAQ